jgi:hypothetical protein
MKSQSRQSWRGIIMISAMGERCCCIENHQYTKSQSVEIFWPQVEVRVMSRNSREESKDLLAFRGFRD